MTKKILVTGAGGAASQNFISSLRISGEPIQIVGSDMNKFHLECSDVQARYQLPSCSSPDYLEKLNQLIEFEGIELVHPQPDPEVAFLARNTAQVRAKLFLPSSTAVEACHDKILSNSLLSKAGVPVPRSFQIKNWDDIPGVVDTLMGEAEKVWVRAIRGAGSKAALPVKTPEQAKNWIKYWVEMKGLKVQDFMIAEYLPGGEFAFQSLWHEGRLVTSMARQRLEYMFGNIMPSGQSSSPSVAVTVTRDDINRIGHDAVLAVDPKPHGVYCVDMKENCGGEPRVTEINIGRFFTTSNFFSAAGSNMPYYYLKLAYGEALPSLPKFNALEAGLYWIRGVDREPTLIRGEKWTCRPVHPDSR